MNFIKILNLLVHQLSPPHFLRILLRVLQLSFFSPADFVGTPRKPTTNIPPRPPFSKIEAEAGRRGTKFSPILVPKSFRLFSTAIMQKPKRNSRHDSSFPSRLRAPLHFECSGRTRRGSLLPQGRRWAEARERQRPNGRTDAVAKKNLAP